MVDFRPLLLSLLFIFVLGGCLTYFVSPYVNNSEPNNESALYGVANFVENGWTIDVPILGNMSFNPITWFWFGIDSVTTFMANQLTVLTYVPDIILVPLAILVVFCLSYSIIVVIKDMIPFT